MITSRRSFLKTSVLAAGAASLSARSWGQTQGANGDVRLCVIGVHGRGKDHVKGFSQCKGVRVAGLCDVDSAVLRKAAGVTPNAKTYGDLRKVFDDPSIDAISIAMPNHWHSLAAIWAMQAGKDVYIEKPICHNVWEGRQLVNLSAQSRQVIQAGTQCRSSVGLMEAHAWMAAGNLGKVKVSRGLCYKRRGSIGYIQGDGKVPATVNYDLWVGPSAMQPPHRRQFHYDWHWFWETGNGDLGNQGIHQMDIARWFLNEPALAPRTISVGGRFGYLDNAETPNTQVIVHDYEAAPLIFEVRGLPASGKPEDHPDTRTSTDVESKPTGAEGMDKYPPGKHGASIGVVVDCEGGQLVIPSYTDAYAYDPAGKLIKRFGGAGGNRHYQNFIDVVHSRKKADLRGPIDGGFVSSALCHTGNISYRLGHRLSGGEIAEQIRGNANLAESFGRMQEHLGRNGVDLGTTPAALGVPLILDPKTERFSENSDANALLTRRYRAPYVVPSIG